MTKDKSDFDVILRKNLQGFTGKTIYIVVPSQISMPNWLIDVLAHHPLLCERGGIKRLVIMWQPLNLKSICASQD